MYLFHHMSVSVFGFCGEDTEGKFAIQATLYGNVVQLQQEEVASSLNEQQTGKDRLDC